MKETPTKSKSTADDIIECSSCALIYSRKDAGRHKLLCTAGQLKEETANNIKNISILGSSFLENIPEKCAHGFIFGDILFGPVFVDVTLPNELRSTQFAALRERIIFLHPKIMTLLNLTIGDSTEAILSNFSVSGDEDYFRCAAARIWPSSTIPLFSIGVPKNSVLFRGSKFTEKCYFSLRKITNAKTASKLELIPQIEKSFFGNDDFLNFSRNYLNGVCLRKDEIIRIPFYGQICEFLTNFESADRKTVEEISTEILTKQISSFKIDEENSIEKENSPSIFSPRTSTPRSSCSTPKSENFIRPPFHVFNQENAYFKIDESTIIDVIDPNFRTVKNSFRPTLNYANLGGMEKIKIALFDHVSACLKIDKIEIADTFFLTIKTILLYGLSGTGKTTLAEAVAGEIKTNFFRIDSVDLSGRTTENGVSFLEEIFEKARQNSPCVILLDDIDFLAPIRENVSISTENSRKFLASVTKFLDQINENSIPIIVIGATSNLDRLHISLRKRFQIELETPVPSTFDRRAILEKIFEKFNIDIFQKFPRNDLEILAQSTHGFTPSDLMVLCREAAVAARRNSPGKPEILVRHFKAALVKIRPSAMREIFVEVPNVRWTDIGGYDDVKSKLQRAIEWPRRFPETFSRLGVQPPTGILLYGPPGCSKTMTAKAVATESGLNFISVKGPELFRPYVGESERAVRELFRKARDVAPSIIFFDEIDALGLERNSNSANASSSNVGERVLAQLLTELDGVQPLTDVTVVAATNRPDVIDKALTRPGRLDRLIYVPLPDDEAREQIFQLKLSKMKSAGDVDAKILVEKTRGYTGAEIVAVCNRAGDFAMSENRQIDAIYERHFMQSLDSDDVRPRTDEKTLKIYEDFRKVFDR